MAPVHRPEHAYKTILKSRERWGQRWRNKHGHASQSISKQCLCSFLLHNGYNGKVFKNTDIKVSRKSVTVHHLTKRIENIQQAKTHSKLFHLKGSGHLTDDDFILAAQKKVIETQIKELQKGKNFAGKVLDVEIKSREILVQTQALQTYNTSTLQVLLICYQVKGGWLVTKLRVSVGWRKGFRKEVQDNQDVAPIWSKWSATDEIYLAKLTSHPINLPDTALGRHQQTIKRKVEEEKHSPSET